jgi:hypothetical protein
MTDHYQHDRNDHADATKATKYIQHYKYKKLSLKSETTENDRLHKIPGNYFVLSTIQTLKIRLYNSFVCTQAHSTQHDFS